MNKERERSTLTKSTMKKWYSNLINIGIANDFVVQTTGFANGLDEYSEVFVVEQGLKEMSKGVGEMTTQVAGVPSSGGNRGS